MPHTHTMTMVHLRFSMPGTENAGASPHAAHPAAANSSHFLRDAASSGMRGMLGPRQEGLPSHAAALHQTVSEAIRRDNLTGGTPGRASAERIPKARPTTEVRVHQGPENSSTTASLTRAKAVVGGPDEVFSCPRLSSSRTVTNQSDKHQGQGFFVSFDPVTSRISNRRQAACKGHDSSPVP